jgi:hypothetical protein
MPHGKININTNINAEAFAFIHGYLDAKVENFAEGMGIPKSVLARWVSDVLSPSRAGHDAGVSALRGGGAEGVDELPQAQVAHGSRRHAQDPDRERAAKSRRGIKAYWARMTAEERRAEIERRMRVHRRNLRAKAKAKTKTGAQEREVA